MRRFFLTGVSVIVVLLGGCGGGNQSTTDSSDHGDSETFRIPVGKVPVRYASDLKFKANGLVGAEPKPIAPEGPAPFTLSLKDLIAGIGSAAIKGEQVTVQYVGVTYNMERKFASSWKEGKPFTFQLGSGAAIEGFEQGIEGMEAGTRRELVVPAGFTRGGSQQKTVPKNANLIFVIDLLSTGEGEPH